MVIGGLFLLPTRRRKLWHILLPGCVRVDRCGARQRRDLPDHGGIPRVSCVMADATTEQRLWHLLPVNKGHRVRSCFVGLVRGTAAPGKQPPARMRQAPVIVAIRTRSAPP